MPRLTQADYLRIHAELRECWLQDDILFAYIQPDEQWSLHDYFKPAHALSPAKLVEHRQQVSREQPSLPQRAGRAYKHFRQGVELAAHVRAQADKISSVPSTKRKNVRSGSVTAWPVVRPEIDVRKLARAMIELARELRRRQEV